MKILKHTDRAKRSPRVLIYGTEGIGKSTWATSAPNPIVIDTEDGLGQLSCDSFPLAEDYGTVLDQLSWLVTGDHDYQTVVIDSIDWLEKLIWKQTCVDQKVASIELVGGGYSKGYTECLTYWRDILETLTMLRDSKRMTTILVAHAKVEKFEDPEAAAYDRYSPRLHKHATAMLCEWCDAVLFATRRIRVNTEDTGFGKKRTTAKSITHEGSDRILRTVGGPACVAKNRFGLTTDLPLEWDAFANAIKESSNG